MLHSSYIMFTCDLGFLWLKSIIYIAAARYTVLWALALTIYKKIISACTTKITKPLDARFGEESCHNSKEVVQIRLSTILTLMLWQQFDTQYNSIEINWQSINFWCQVSFAPSPNNQNYSTVYISFLYTNRKRCLAINCWQLCQSVPQWLFS